MFDVSLNSRFGLISVFGASIEMATPSTKKLETLLECPICLEKVTEPLLFECLHFYCKPCVGDMKPKTHGNVTGYECPTCRNITPKDKLREMHFIHELLDIVDMAKKEQTRICDMCKEVPADHKCHDCKEIFCSNCMNQHNSTAIRQNHRWEPLEQGADAVLDKHVYCAKHPQEIVKFHCKDCKMLICPVCFGTMHKQHSAETIDEALEHTLSMVRENQEKIKKVITQNEAALAKATADIANVEEHYDQIEKQIEQKREEIMRKVLEDSEELKRKLAKTQSAHVDEIQQIIKTTDLTLKSQKNILRLSNTTLATAHSTILLQTLQAGVTQGLLSHLEDSPRIVKCQVEAEVVYKEAQLKRENLLGDIPTRECVTTEPRLSPNNRSLSEVVKVEPKLVKETQSSFLCTQFVKMNDEIYCNDCNSSEIHVYDENIVEIRHLTLNDTGEVQSVAYVDPFLLIASEKGLYHSNMDGSNVQNILSGHMNSICWRGDVGYILDDTNNKVVVITFNSATKTFAKSKEIKLDLYDDHWANTLQVTPDSIWIAIHLEHVIRKYNHDGTLLSSHDASHSAMGKLKHPLLCGQDAAGCLLIADCGNHRLVTLSPGGEWQRLQLGGLNLPLCAMVDNNHLFVTQQYPTKIIKYTLY